MQYVTALIVFVHKYVRKQLIIYACVSSFICYSEC